MNNAPKTPCDECKKFFDEQFTSWQKFHVPPAREMYCNHNKVLFGDRIDPLHCGKNDCRIC